MTSWLERLLEQTKEAESPRSFIYWAGLSAISAVVRNNVYLDKFYYKLAPNLFVLLIAPSGGRKGFPIYVAKELVKEVNNTRVISGRNSVQAIVNQLSIAHARADGPPLIDATAFLVASEFSSFLIHDPQALTILTDLYDTHYNGDWKNTLKGSGIETLKNVYLTMLGASNQTHLLDAVNSVSVTGGFIGRTLLVVEHKKSRINPLTEQPEVKFDLKDLASYLKELAQVKGQFQYTAAGKHEFELWYRDYCEKLEREDRVDDRTGTADRLNDHVLKVAMLLSLARDKDLSLKETDIAEAIDVCLKFSTNANKVTAGGSSETDRARQTKLFTAELLTREGYKITKSDLLRKYWGDMTAEDLDKIVDTFNQADALDIQNINGKVIYTLTDKFINQYQQFKKRETQ